MSAPPFLLLNFINPSLSHAAACEHGYRFGAGDMKFKWLSISVFNSSLTQAFFPRLQGWPAPSGGKLIHQLHALQNLPPLSTSTQATNSRDHSKFQSRKKIKTSKAKLTSCYVIVCIDHALKQNSSWCSLVLENNKFQTQFDVAVVRNTAIWLIQGGKTDWLHLEKSEALNIS